MLSKPCEFGYPLGYEYLIEWGYLPRRYELAVLRFAQTWAAYRSYSCGGRLTHPVRLHCEIGPNIPSIRQYRIICSLAQPLPESTARDRFGTRLLGREARRACFYLERGWEALARKYPVPTVPSHPRGKLEDPVIQAFLRRTYRHSG